ncbi:MAG: HDOD domain-containing protein [Candidatus Solibacter usitatus]|nr:HDOD domain-containing protein [Candidatus Solibacter usitatus]
MSYRDLALRSLDQLPPFSPVLNHLMASLADEDVSFARLAAVIERDSVLSGNVLRLVNSALYGRRGTVSSVRAAVAVLGMVRLRNYLMGFSVARLWNKVRTPPEWSMERFNNHSVAVAVLSDILVQKTTADYAEGAFVAGLLHDLGRLMIAIALPEEFAQILQAQRASGDPLEKCEQELLEVTHSELSASALARWSLPEPIRRAVLYHHRSDMNAAAAAHSTAHPLSRVVECADEAAKGLGYAIVESGTEQARPVPQVLARLGLKERSGEITDAFESEIKTVLASF